MIKKIFIALGIIIILALAIWLLFFRNNNAPLAEVIRNALPFGSGEGINGPMTNDQSPMTGGGELAFDEFGQPTVNLFRLAVEPVAGAVTFNKSSTTEAVRYVDRATGHIFEIVLPNVGVPGQLKKIRISNKTLPKIYEAYFKPDGSTVLLRSLKDDSDTVENITLTLTPPKATSTDGLYSISAALLRGDIGDVAVGAGNTLYYSLTDSTAIVSSAWNSQALKTLLTSAFTDWRLAAAGNSLMIYTKASSDAPGYAYSLNSSNGSLNKLLGPLNGLTAVLDASGTRILYSYVEGRMAKSAAKNLQTGTVTDISPVTLAEKCVWGVKSKGVVYCASPTDGIGANEPDNWYKGLTHFSDRLWRFDTNGEIAQILSEPKVSLGVDLDVIEPKLSPNEDYLIFINKKDLSLWALKLESF